MIQQSLSPLNQEIHSAQHYSSIICINIVRVASVFRKGFATPTLGRLHNRLQTLLREGIHKMRHSPVVEVDRNRERTRAPSTVRTLLHPCQTL